MTRYKFHGVDDGTSNHHVIAKRDGRPGLTALRYKRSEYPTRIAVRNHIAVKNPDWVYVEEF